MTRAMAALLSLLLVGCGGGGSSSSDDPTSSTGPPGGDVIVYDLLEEGRHSCVDEAGDVTISAEAQAPPPREVPSADLLEAGVEIRDDETFVARFEVAGPIELKADPQYLVFIGLAPDPDSFELRAVSEDGAWGVNLLRAQGAAGHRPIPTAAVTVEGKVLTMEVPMAEMPIITPNTPVNYGSTAVVLGEDGEQIDAQGDRIPPEGSPLRALDDCLFQ